MKGTISDGAMTFRVLEITAILDERVPLYSKVN
jgi:hypothetical protein